LEENLKVELKKSKVFSRKLVALFLAALLAVSTFTGVMSVFAKSRDGYNDDKLAANFLAWAETTDNQTAEALLDYADLYLPQIMEGLDLGDIKPRGTTRINFSYDVPVIGTIAIKGYVDSIDGVLDLIRYVQEDVLNKKVLGQSLKNWAGGDVQNIDLSAVYDLNTSTTDGVVSKCGVAYRSQNDAKKVIITIAKLIYMHCNDYGGKNVLNQFVTGNLNLGLIGNFLNLWDTLKDPLGMWDNYQTNLVYNIVCNLIWENTDWYSESQIEVFKQAFVNNGKNQTAWDFDNELFGKLTSELLQKINIEVTYSNKVPQIELDPNNSNYGKIIKDKNGDTVYDKDSSKRRWFLINNYMKNQNLSYEDAVAAVNENEGTNDGFWCDPNLRYDMNEDGTSDGNILLFTYGDKTLTVEKTDSANTIAFNALEIAWQTVLEPTLGLLEVDYERKVDSSVFEKGTEYNNFDRSYYNWKSAHSGWVKSDTNANKWKENYSAANVEAWAAAVYNNYRYKAGVTPSAANFLKGVKEIYDFDRTRVEEAQNNWRDIDATKLFVELRYSPLADIYFDMQTGPINLYFAETGFNNVKTFFKTAFTDYSSIPSLLNNALVAGVKDIFPDSNNIGMTVDGEFVSLARPDMATTSGVDSQTIASTLVTNAAHVFEYAANAADENILGAFYAKNPSYVAASSNSLSETNFEEAALPMMLAILNQFSISDVIHETEWDNCVDAEGVAVTALAEYLSYVIPDKDYSPLYKVENGALVSSGKYDINSDGKYDLFNDAIMPMARDAVGYLLQSVVTVRKENGTEWSVYTSDPLTDKTSIFTLLNSVLCYYASTDSFENSQGSGTSTITGKGAAALLGCVDSNGKCTVSFSKSLWQNIDTIANTLLPVIGSIQNGHWGEADSYDLIYTKFIEGILDIGKNGGGITNLIKQIIDIIWSTPTTTGADVALYDYVVAPTVNAIFGPKYSGQTLNVIPTSASYFASDSSNNTSAASPFNALIHVDTLGGFNSMGVLSTLVSNLVEAFGVNDYWSKSDDRWQGAMFAVKAVNNFIPSFVPQLSDHTFGPVTSKMDIPTYSGMSSNQSLGTGNYLTITNTAIGLNRFYRPGPNQKVVREPRYFAEIKSVNLKNDDGVTGPRLQSTNLGVLSPGEYLKIPIIGNAPRQQNKTYVFKAAVTYNMFKGELNDGEKPSANGKYIFPSDITTYSYLVITVGNTWQSALYPDNRAEKDGDEIVKYRYVQTSTTNNNAGASFGTGDAAVINSTAGGEDNNLVASVPKTIVIPSDNPSIVNKYSIRVYNSNGSNSRTYNGAVAYINEGTQYYAVNDKKVANTLSTMDNDSSSNMAYAYIDSEGNLLKRDYYDYRIDDGEWVRGFSREELTNMEQNGSIKEEFNAGRITERTHITYTFDEAVNAGIVTGVQRTANSDGTYSYQNVFVNPNTTLVSESKNGITFVTPFGGFYFQNHGSQVAKQDSNYDLFLAYDGNGVSAQKDAYKLNVAFIPESGNKMTVSTDVYVADQSDQYSLTEAVQEEVTKMASYRPSDFLDFNGSTSEDYNSIINAMTEANKLAATPLTGEAASKISSTKITQAEVKETTNHGGDRAYVPANADQIPASVLAGAYKSGDIYYLNKECTMPIYSNVALTDATVVGLKAGDPATGKDSAGQDVVKYGGVWYLANEPEYGYEWDTTTYWYTNPEDEMQKIGAPYYAPVKDEEHLVKWGDSQVYLQKQFVYRDAYGNKVNSDDRYDNGNYKWVVKFAAGETVIKPNDGTDYRGAYQQGIDTINYYNSIFSKILKSVGAQSVAEEVTAVRNEDSNSVNYDVATYEKMVQIAREAENLIWYEDAKDNDGNYIYDEDGNRTQIAVTDKSSMEIEIAVDRFKEYYQRALDNRRDYIGDRLEKEISDHHAIGGSYANFTAAKTGEQVRFEYSTKAPNEEDNVDVYTVSVAEGTNLGFGTRAADGSLVNADAEGNKIYTDESWAAYVNALGAAVDAATEGNNPAVADADKPRVSEVYTAKSHLVMAENNLQIYTGEEGEDNNKFTVSGKVTIAMDSQGASGTTGIGGIELYMGDELVGVSEEDGSFEIKVPKGEPVGLTLKGVSTVPRDITINGDADVTDIFIPVVVVDYQKDGKIDYRDVALFVDFVDEPEAYNVYADLLKDGKVDYRDVAYFVDFVDVPVEYAAWSQTDPAFLLN
jgi:hypothetical protein